MVLESVVSNVYLRVLIEFVLLFFLLRIGYTFLQKIVLKLSLKTKTELDDLIIKRASKPVTFLVFFLSLKLLIDNIPLSESNLINVQRIISSFMAFVFAYLIYSLIDIIIVTYINRFSKKTKTKVDESLVSLVHGVLKIIFVIISLLYILSIWGVEILPLLGALGVAGLAVALALQPTLSNIFSGMSMVFDKTVAVGDLVYLDQNTKGKITKIGLRSTKILTFDNELIIVPNTKLADSILQNVALPEPKSRVVIQFSVAYGTDIEKVKKLVLKEIDSIKIVSKDPKPMVRFIEMAESSINFKAYFFVDTYDQKFDAIDEANTKIYNALNKAKIEIPFPQVAVHLKRK